MIENSFSKKMSVKSDYELQEIIDNKDKYQEEACLAAINELEKRQLAEPKLIEIRETILNKKKEIEEGKEVEEEDSEKRKTLAETLAALIPNKTNYITPAIICLNILVYVIMVSRGVHPVEPSVESLFNWGGNLNAYTLNGQQWRLLTCVFLHSGIFHLLLNMYALLFIGKEIETQFGKSRYLFTFIVTGVLASIASITINDNIVSVGASGAIFGMYGLLIVLFFTKRISIPEESRKQFITSVISFVGYNLLYGFTQEGIDNAAHIGGVLSGALLGGIFSLSTYKSNLSKGISIVVSITLLMMIFALPKLITNKIGEYEKAMEEFVLNEEKALWMYNEDFSKISDDRIQYYYEKFDKEGVFIWRRNIELLDSLKDMPSHLAVNISILKEYSQLRIESCSTMKKLLIKDNKDDADILTELNLKIEEKINQLETLNK